LGACFLKQEGLRGPHPDQTKEVIVTYSVPRTTAIAFGVAAFVSMSALSAARADSSTPAPTPGWAEAGPNGATVVHRPAPASTASSASLSEPATTPGWAEYGPAGTVHHPSARHSAHHHYAYRDERRSDNPVGTVAMRVAGGAADLGSVAAYPFYCFPNYGSCSVRVPYRY
jgi:hypothetical protein